MRYFLLLLTVLILSCGSHNKNNKSPNSAYIYKIESINDYYLIYAKRNDSLFKIVSKKESTENCLTIKKGQSYNLNLKSLYDVAPIINGVKIYTFQIDCYAFDEQTSICLERNNGIHDLYFTDDIIGLCYKKE
ncbi:hypothetical protein [Flavobacterium beibuense]|uniref:hypothetical protein n=1 Tax=Flavobacterium beibuense TaxID=657326 RepID=UPI003A91A8B1